MDYRRIVPCLDVKDGRLVKGVKFVELKDVGDPAENAGGKNFRLGEGGQASADALAEALMRW